MEMRFFHYPGDVAELAQRRRAGFFRRHTACDVFLSFAFDVLAEVVAGIIQRMGHGRPSSLAGRKMRARARAG